MEHIQPLTTREAARKLGVTYYQMFGLIRFDRIEPLPPKGGHGGYMWYPADLERAKGLLHQN